VIGAQGNDRAGADAGAVYLVTWEAATWSLGDAGLRVRGVDEADGLGVSALLPGDLSGDGIADLVSGSLAYNGDDSSAGAVVILAGAASW
jgi:hypothetical protein